MNTDDRIIYLTRADAEQALNGVIDWEWGGKASFYGCVDYLWKHGSLDHDRGINTAIAEYLTTVGEDPREYGVL